MGTVTPALARGFEFREWPMPCDEAQDHPRDDLCNVGNEHTFHVPYLQRACDSTPGGTAFRIHWWLKKDKAGRAKEGWKSNWLRVPPGSSRLPSPPIWGFKGVEKLPPPHPDAP